MSENKSKKCKSLIIGVSPYINQVSNIAVIPEVTKNLVLKKRRMEVWLEF